MFRSIWDDVKREFNYGNMVTRIIMVNVGVFIFVHLVHFFLWVSMQRSGTPPSVLFQNFIHFFCVSADWKFLLTHPWGIVTHMFLHQGVFHILWNMLFLFWFGRIVGDFISNERVLPLYLLGGLAGAAMYLITENVYSTGSSFALGASAAVMAIVVAAGTISPDYIVRLLFLGNIKLKYIVIFLVLLDIIAVPNSGGNTGGAFGHLGGALFGFVFVRQLREGNDMAVPVNNFFDRIIRFFTNLFQPDPVRKGPRVVYKRPTKERVVKGNGGGKAKKSAGSRHTDLSHQEQLDAILDKIKQTGYESLSPEEKEFLFKASKK